MSRFFRDVWRGLLFALSLPLRIMTGRWQPDYRRIRELELICGLEKASERLDSLPPLMTANQYRARAGLPALPPCRGTAAWDRDYEAGKARTRAWLDSLPPVQGSDVRAYREQLGDWYNR